MINGNGHQATQPKKELTELDRKLQEMALLNWTQFVKLVGADAIIAAKICLLRQADRSYGEISQKLSISERRARYWCGECEIKEIKATA